MAGNGKQNSKEFSVLTTDRRRRNSRVRFCISSEDREIVEAIVYSERFPYKFPADFYRDAVRIRLDELSRLEHLGELVTQQEAEPAPETDLKLRVTSYYWKFLEKRSPNILPWDALKRPESFLGAPSHE